MLAPVETIASTMLFSIISTKTCLSPALTRLPARQRMLAHSPSAIMWSTILAARARSRALKAMSAIASTSGRTSCLVMSTWRMGSLSSASFVGRGEGAS